MAAVANWATRQITIPLSDLTVITPGVRYSLTSDKLWELLRELAGSEEGIAQTYTPDLFPFRRTAATAGTPQITDLINNYFIQFGSGPYTLDITDGNTNLGDPAVHPAGDQVSVNTNNTAGAIQVGSGVTEQDKIDIANAVMNYIVENGETFIEQIRLMRAEAAGDIVRSGDLHTIKSADGNTDRIVANADENGRDVTATDGT